MAENNQELHVIRVVGPNGEFEYFTKRTHDPNEFKEQVRHWMIAEHQANPQHFGDFWKIEDAVVAKKNF